ncbi:MAG: hypothetical protein KJ552_14760 [Gammaproteobacteria bacterium]|nr:hypothetical protein [Gammaproteobacteria bacterium]
MKIQTTDTNLLKNLFNIHLKNNSRYEEGMSFDEVAIENGRIIAKANFNYPDCSLDISELQEVYSDTLQGFGL